MNCPVVDWSWSVDVAKLTALTVPVKLHQPVFLPSIVGRYREIAGSGGDYCSRASRWSRRSSPESYFCALTFVGDVGTVASVPWQPDHQHGFPEIKSCMACHLGGALLSGEVVCMIDSSPPQTPY